MLRKGLAVAVILLFIGVAFTPSINANVVKDDLVEFDVEVHGLGKKNTVKLTQQETDEVEQLLDDIRKTLDNAETKEEAIEILNDAVVELDKYDLLGGLSVNQAQSLITGKYENQRPKKPFNNWFNPPQLEEKDIFNKNCFFIGDFVCAQDYCNIFYILGIVPVLLGVIFFLTTFIFIPISIAMILTILSDIIGLFFLGIGASFFAISNLKPLHLYDMIHLDKYVPSKVKSFVSIGDMGRMNYTSPDDWWSMGINGVTGISIIKKLLPLEEIYIGRAHEVYVSPDW